MRNVRDRLQLIYGSAAELRIESQVGEGTVVTILLPLAMRKRTGICTADRRNKACVWTA